MIKKCITAWLIWVLLKIKGPKHTHIVEDYKLLIQKGHWFAYWIKMDCPVNPEKVVVMRSVIIKEFDPHFSNEEVIAIFKPSEDGQQLAFDFVRRILI